MDFSPEEREHYEETYKIILKSILDSPEVLNNENIRDWLQKIFDYNVPNGKGNRTKILLAAYKSFANVSLVDKTTLTKLFTLGWIVEIQHTGFVVANDIVKDAKMRRNSITWHMEDNLGHLATNDSIIFQIIIYSLIQRYFSNETYYVEIIELFRDCHLKTTYGELIDLIAERSKQFKIQIPLDENFDFSSKHKCGYRSFYLPVNLARILANYKSTNWKNIENFLFEFGWFSYFQNQYLEYFGEDLNRNANCTEIELKIIWFFRKAIEMKNEKGKTFLNELAHKKEIGKLINIYKELGLDTEFELEELEKYSTMKFEMKRVLHKNEFELLDGIMSHIFPKEIK